MTGRRKLLHAVLVGFVAATLASQSGAAQFSIARLYIEYNASANDLGFHVSLDGANWKSMSIVNPRGRTIFEVEGAAAYATLGMTELFFEGAEPNLDDFPLADLLALFPEGRYKFNGLTVGGERISNRVRLSHAVPDGPSVSAQVYPHTVVIRWDPVTCPPDGFPDRHIEIVGYQVIVESFQITLPASSTEVTVPREFVDALAPGEHAFEVLAIEKSGNQTLTEGWFVK